MPGDYAFLVAGLPTLSLEIDSRGFSFVRLRNEVNELLGDDDKLAMAWLFYPSDNRNLLLLLAGKAVDPDPTGNFSAVELASFLEDPALAPAYMRDFLQMHFAKESFPDSDVISTQFASHPELHLLNRFYLGASSVAHRFVRDWLEFDRDFRNIVAAYAARLWQKPTNSELVGEGSLVESLSGNSTPELLTGPEEEWMRNLLEVLPLRPAIAREKQLDLIRWQWLDSYTAFHYLDEYVVFAHMLKAGIVERWLRLDPKSGMELFRRMMAQTRGTYRLADALE